MRLGNLVAALAAGVLLVGTCCDGALGGWFGLGGPGSSADTSNASKSGYYNPNPAKSVSRSSKAASNSNKGFWGGFGSAFNGSKTDPKKGSGLYSSKPKKQDAKKNSSWWNSWMKPKPKKSPPLKTTGDWMKLKQVQW